MGVVDRWVVLVDIYTIKVYTFFVGLDVQTGLGFLLPKHLGDR